MDTLVVRVRSCAVVLVIALAGATPLQAGTNREAGGLSASRSLEAGLLSAINSVRVRHGLRPVRLSAGLAAAARLHSLEMATSGVFAHESPDGGLLSKRIARFYSSTGYRSWAVGENLLWSSPDVTSPGAVKRWLQSQRHRAILLSPGWTEVGLAAVHARSAPGAFGGLEVTIVTADFGARSS
jgi:uncharacterized protein YkwD